MNVLRENKAPAIHFLLFAGGLLLALIAFYLPWLCNQQSFYLSDLTYYFEPLINYACRRMREGSIPLWNPLSFCGMPQVANPSPGIFYPPNWIWLVSSFNQGLASSMILHQWICGVGMYLLIMGLGWGAVAAAVAGLIAAMCGYMFSLQANFTLVDSIAWLPLCMWSLSRIGSNKKAPAKFLYATCAGVCVALTLLAGRPEISTPAMLLIIVYVLLQGVYELKSRKWWHYFQRNTNAQAAKSEYLETRKIVLHSTYWQIGAIIWGLLLSMPMLLPAVEWAHLSTRGNGLANKEVFIWSANWYDFMSMILAQPLGDLNVLGAKFLGVAASRANYIPFVSSCFVGPVAVTLALWGLLDRTWKLRPLIVIMLTASVVMSLGNYTPVAPWLMSSFHALALFRYPEKLLIFVLLSVAVLSARGTYVVLQGSLRRLTLLQTASLWCVWSIVMCLLTIPSTSGYFAKQVIAHHGSAVSTTILSQALSLIGTDGLGAGLLGLAVCAAVALKQRDKINHLTFSIFTVGTLCATLVLAACASSRHGTEPNYFKHASFLDTQLRTFGFDSSTRVLSLFFDPLTYPTDHLGFPGQDKTTQFYQYGRQLLLPNTHMDADIPASYGYEAAETSEYRKLFQDVYHKSSASAATKSSTPTKTSAPLDKGNLSGSYDDLPLARFCQMTCTHFACSQIYKGKNPQLSLPILDNRYFKILYENRPMNVRIYRVLKPLPQVYFPASWRAIKSSDEFRQLILGSSHNNFDPAGTVYIDLSSNEIPSKSALSQSSSPMQNNDQLQNDQLHTNDQPSVQVLKRQPETLSLSVSTGYKRLLVCADHFYPGWKATVDYATVPILKVDGILRGVFVPAGMHTVTFSYEPQSLLLGLWLAGAGALIWATGAVVVAVPGCFTRNLPT